MFKHVCARACELVCLIRHTDEVHTQASDNITNTFETEVYAMDETFSQQP